MSSKDQKAAEELVSRLMKGVRTHKGKGPNADGSVVSGCMRGNKPAPFPGTSGKKKKGGKR